MSKIVKILIVYKIKDNLKKVKQSTYGDYLFDWLTLNINVTEIKKIVIIKIFNLTHSCVALDPL